MKTIVILSHVGFDSSPYCNYVHSHAKALAKQGYKVIVLAIISWVPILSKLQNRKKEFMKRIKGENKVQEIDGVTVIYKKAMTFSNFLYNSKLNLNGIFYYLSIKRLFKKIYKNENVVLIDAHTFRTEGYVAFKLKRKYKNLTTTVTLHGTSFARNVNTKNGVKAIKKILNVVDYTVCVSEKLARIAREKGVENTVVIYNGINEYKLEPVDKKIYKFNIITVGNLIPFKNQNICIEVVDRLRKKYPDIRLCIVGSGQDEKKLRQLVKEKKLEKIVTFTGRLDSKNVMKLMNKSNIFLLPSINEGFGITYIEAMHAGALAIGTKNEGIDGVIKNAENGFLVEPNIDKIELLITEIYSEKYNIEEIRKNAYDTSKVLTWNNNARKYIDLIKCNKKL